MKGLSSDQVITMLLLLKENASISVQTKGLPTLLPPFCFKGSSIYVLTMSLLHLTLKAAKTTDCVNYYVDRLLSSKLLHGLENFQNIISGYWK